jgi:sulfite exporter TauE/SafE
MTTLAGLWLPGATLGAPALLLAGLAASPHCALMCGPLAALGARVSNAGSPRRALVLTQAGRVLGYGALGALAGASGQWLMGLLPALAAGRLLQGAAAVASLAVGLWLLLGKTRIASCCAPRARPGLPPVLRGLLWAALPCGILYAVLLLAALSGGPLNGALLASAFALGGAPLLALIGWLGAKRPATPLAARAAGLWLAVLGVATLFILAGGAPAAATWCAAR